MAILSEAFTLAGHINRASSAVAGNPEDSTYPSSNLLLPVLSTVWRSPVGSLSSVTLRFYLGALRTDIEHVILHGVNFTTGATRRIRLADQVTAFTGGAGTITADSGTGAAFDMSLGGELLDPTPPWGRTVAYFPAATVSAAYVELVISDPSLIFNQLEASHLSVGPVWQPGKNFSEDWRRNDQPAGQPGLEKILRGHQFNLHRLTEAEAAKVLSLCRNLKRVGRIYVIPQPKTPATWGEDLLLTTIATYSRAIVPKLPGYRSVGINFLEVDD